jgi:hypothetical protein
MRAGTGWEMKKPLKGLLEAELPDNPQQRFEGLTKAGEQLTSRSRGDSVRSKQKRLLRIVRCEIGALETLIVSQGLAKLCQACFYVLPKAGRNRHAKTSGILDVLEKGLDLALRLVQRGTGSAKRRESRGHGEFSEGIVVEMGWFCERCYGVAQGWA